MKFESLLIILAANVAVLLSGCNGSAVATSASVTDVSKTVPASIDRMDIAHAVLTVPTSLQIAAGSSAQLQAQVNDASAQPVGGASIVFGSNDPAMIAVTQQGVVSALGPVGVTAVTIASGVRVVEVSVRVLPGPGAVLDVLQAPPTGTEAGGPIGEIAVRVRDQFNNPVPRAPLRWHVDEQNGAIASSDDVTDADGTGTARWIAGLKAGPQTLSVHSGDLPPLVLLANVLPGSPTALRILADPLLKDGASLKKGERIRIQAIVTDRNGNGVPGREVRLETSGACELDPLLQSTGSSGATSATDWSASDVGPCVWSARIERPAIETRLAFTVEPALPQRR